MKLALALFLASPAFLCASAAWDLGGDLGRARSGIGLFLLLISLLAGGVFLKRAYASWLTLKGLPGRPTPGALAAAAGPASLAAAAVIWAAWLGSSWSPPQPDLRLSLEGITRSNLAALRASVSLCGKGGACAESLEEAAKGHGGVQATHLRPYHDDTGMVRQGKYPDDAGGWVYDAGPPAKVYVNCIHTDARGTIWASY